MADPRRPITLNPLTGDEEQLPVLAPLRQDALNHPLDGGDFFTEPAVIPINYDGGTF